MKIIAPAVIQTEEDLLISQRTIIAEKRLRDLAGIYLNAAGMDPDTLMYRVSTLNPSAEGDGQLCWGMSVLEPVLVNGECNMTRGHFHARSQDDEIYVGRGGEGLLMLMDETGNTWCEKVFRGSFHYISGRYAHRLINTGSTQLRVLCCWPSAAGHDYARVEQMPFASRVFLQNGCLEVKPHEHL